MQAVGIGIKDFGFWAYVKAHWWLALLSIVGLARIIIFITPSKKDDRFIMKYVIRPLRMIAQFLSLSKK